MPFDLIHRHNANATALSFADIREACPAAFSDHATPDASERYGFVSTANAINILLDHGFEPVRAIQKPVRKASELPFADHMLTFRPIVTVPREAETRAEIILYNSHNAKSALKLFVGAFRFVCSNGLVAGEGFEAKLRHNRLTAQKFSDLLSDQAKALPALLDRIERFKETTVEPEAVQAFVLKAAQLRWQPLTGAEGLAAIMAKDTRGSYATELTLQDLDWPRRYGDIGKDAWRVFNRVQEGLIRGGVNVLSFTDRKPAGAYRRAKAVQSLPETVRINRQLWDMADAMV